MRKLTALLATAGAALTIVGTTAAPALAIDNVVCRDGAGFAEIHNEKRHCFANAGSMIVYIDNVYFVRSGNNSIGINWYNRHTGESGYDTIVKFREKTYSPRVTVKQIIIL